MKEGGTGMGDMVSYCWLDRLIALELTKLGFLRDFNIIFTVL